MKWPFSYSRELTRLDALLEVSDFIHANANNQTIDGKFYKATDKIGLLTEAHSDLAKVAYRAGYAGALADVITHISDIGGVKR